ncbi:unnamed protein product [Schistosoma turkestanicum]|nr:unnamed protein product [Schistosoma turkestanicum]
MSKNAKGIINEKLQFEDVVKFTGLSICKSSGDILKESAASLILTKVDPKSKLSSHLKCYENFITFYPEISVNGVNLEGRISLQEILGFFVSPKHPKSLVILFQHSPFDDVTLYGMVLSSSSKAQKLTRLLGEPNDQLNGKGEPMGSKVKSVTISPKIHNPPNGCYKEDSGALETKELLNALPPPGNRYRSELVWNKITGQQSKEKFSQNTSAVHPNGRLSQEGNQPKLGKRRNNHLKSTYLMKNHAGISSNHAQSGQNLSKSNNFFPASANGHVFSRQPFVGDTRISDYNNQMSRQNTGWMVNSERVSDESGLDTPFPYNPNENIEEFSIGYYNIDDGSGIDDNDILHIKNGNEVDTNDPQENPWVENITYISSNKNGRATITSDGPVYLYVAQQVNPRFEMTH